MTQSRVGTMPVRSGRYADGVQSYQRMTTLLKNIETDTFNLDEWRENMTAIGIVGRDDLRLGIAAAAQFDPITGKLTKAAKDTLRGLRRQAIDFAKSRAGSNRGNAIHTATERLDFGETVEQISLPYPFNADLRAYDVLKRAMRLSYRPEHIERTVRLRAAGVAGSYDRLGSCGLLEEMGILQPGELIVVDAKTEQDPLLNLMHITPQLAGYANADDVFVPNGETLDSGEPVGSYEPMPRVNKQVALVIHIRDGAATPYLVNIVEGWKDVQRAVEQRDRLKASKVKLGEPGCWAALVPVQLPAATQIVAQQAAPALAAAREAHAIGGVRCSNCAPFDAGASADRVDGSDLARPCQECGRVSVPTQVAVRRPDGMTEFVPASAEQVARVDRMIEHAHAAAPAVAAPSNADEARTLSMILDALNACDTMQHLAETYERVTRGGIAWVGQIARAGEIRGSIVQCPQRELHTVGTCACGWREGLRS